MINYHSFKNRIHSMVKNFGLRRLLPVLPVHLCACVATALAYAARGQPGKAAAIAAALLWNAAVLPGTLKRRRAVQRLRVIDDDELMSWAMVRIPLDYYAKLYREYEIV